MEGTTTKIKTLKHILLSKLGLDGLHYVQELQITLLPAEAPSLSTRDEILASVQRSSAHIRNLQRVQ